MEPSEARRLLKDTGEALRNNQYLFSHEEWEAIDSAVEQLETAHKARGQRIADQANEIQELQELFVYFFGENYRELGGDDD